MDQHRLARLASVLADATGASVLVQILGVATEVLAVTGASIAIIGQGEHLGAVAVTDPATAAIDDLQFSLGEGPCLDADAEQRPVLEGDLRDAFTGWPAFAPAAVGLGTHAAFAIPLAMGAARVGVMSLYRDSAGDLSSVDLADVSAIARMATNVMIDLQANLAPGHLPPSLTEVGELRRHVHQATGMIAAQLNSDVATALSHLRAFAWSTDRTIDEVSTEVVRRELRFDER